MKLINADKLKAEIYKHDNGCIDIDFDLVIDIIDNAPTVDMNTELSVAYLKGRRQGQSEERPQGEWTTTKGSLEINCSVCHQSYFYHPKNDFYYNFCPTCGSDMRGAENG